MNLIDSHCHLDFPELAGRVESELDACFNVGVQQIIVPGVAASDWQRIFSIAEIPHSVKRHIALGLHPCFLDKHNVVTDLETLENQLSTRRDVVAIGECGLDLFIDNPQFETQRVLFDGQLELAKKFDLPVILHVRRSVDLVLKTLRRHQLKSGGVAHAFSGSLQQAQEFTKLGFYIGVGGSVTYERAQRLRKVVADISLDKILLETDSPDMPLSGFQSEPNRPSRIKLVAECLAELRGVSVGEVAEWTTRNTKLLFGI